MVSFGVGFLTFENATHAFVLQTTDRTLCAGERGHACCDANGVPWQNVSAWDARPLNTRVKPSVFVRALAAAACTSGRGGGGGGAAVLAEVPSPAATAPFEYSALRSVVLDNG